MRRNDIPQATVANQKRAKSDIYTDEQDHGSPCFNVERICGSQKRTWGVSAHKVVKRVGRNNGLAFRTDR